MTKKEAIEAAWNNSMSYEEYIELIEKLHFVKRATSFPENEEYFEYSLMSLTRMNRVFKKTEAENELMETINSVKNKQKWILITESWCGDASQTVPVIAKLASLGENIVLRIVLRDSNPDIMDHYLTNGGMSIPILVVLNDELEEITTWGPRPVPAQQLLVEYKALPEPRPSHAEFSLGLQKWYNGDKGATTRKGVIGNAKKDCRG